MKHKVLAIVVSLTLILSMVLPGTLAVSTAQDSATSVMTAADTTAKTEESTTATPTTATPTTGSQTEKKCNCTPVNGVHAAACPLYEVPKADEKTADTAPGTAASTTDGTGAPTEKTCNCGATGDTHAATCPLYVAPKTEETAGAPTAQPPAETEKTCTCGSTDGTHTAECALYVKPEESKSEENAPTTPTVTEPQDPAVSALFDQLMACKTLDELFTLVDKIPEAQLLALTDEQNAQIEAKIAALEPDPLPPVVIGETKDVPVTSEIIYPTVNFDKVAPFGAPVGG